MDDRKREPVDWQAGMHYCPWCNRSWPFDGSWQQDDRCFTCDRVPPAKPGSVMEAQTLREKAKAESSECFVVTATMGSPSSLVVRHYRRLRDSVLSRHALGLAMTRSYYNWGPRLALLVSRHQLLRLASAAAILLALPFVATLNWLATPCLRRKLTK